MGMCLKSFVLNKLNKSKIYKHFETKTLAKYNFVKCFSTKSEEYIYGDYTLI